MTLAEFAKMCGVTIVRCDKEWGGTYGYKEVDHPNCQYNGFKTERAAYDRWLEDKFGKQTAKVLLKTYLKPEISSKGKPLETSKAS